MHSLSRCFIYTFEAYYVILCYLDEADVQVYKFFTDDIDKVSVSIYIFFFNSCKIFI